MCTMYIFIFHRENDGKKPTIIINFNHFVKILAKIDRNSLIIGGEYDSYNKKITKFFDKLRECNAKLVFFIRPFLNHMDKKTIFDAYDHAVRNSLDRFKTDLEKMGKHFPWHLDKRFLYNLVQICSEYGEIHTLCNGITFNIVQYARQHQDEVLAMIQHDTDYLLFEGQYQYWSLADLDILRFKTKKYCRDILYKRIQLDFTKQCQMLSALSRLNRDSVDNLVRDIKTEEKSGKTIFKIATYIRNVEDLNSLESIASDIFGENYTTDQLKEIQHELSRFEMSEPDNLDGHNQNFRDLIDFFLEKNLYFAYGLAVGTVSTNQTLVYIDLRQEDSSEFIELMTTILMKQCGIVFKDMEERPLLRAVEIHRSIDAKNNDESDEAIIYPPRKLQLFFTFYINS